MYTNARTHWLLFILLTVVFLIPFSAHAESVLWNKSYNVQLVDPLPPGTFYFDPTVDPAPYFDPTPKFNPLYTPSNPASGLSPQNSPNFNFRHKSVQKRMEDLKNFQCWPSSYYAKYADPNISIQYRAEAVNADTGAVVPCGSSVPQGTRLTFRFIPHTYRDISWVLSGGSFDTPYGSWIKNAARPYSDMCSNFSGNDFIRKDKTSGLDDNIKAEFYVTLSVNPPEKTLKVSTMFSCSGDSSSASRTCTARSAGTGNVKFQWNDTTGKMYSRTKVTEGGEHEGCKVKTGECKTSNDPLVKRDSNNNLKGDFIVSVPNQTLTCPITITTPSSENESPAMMNLSAVGSCTVGQSHTISMRATDPDNDKIRYLIDWDANGSVDQIVPSSGYVNAGTSQTASRTFGTPGSKKVKVRAEDKNGALSGWSTLTFSCSNSQSFSPPPPETQCSDGIDNDGDGLIDLLDSNCSDSADVSEFSAAPPPPPPGPGPADLSIRAVPSIVQRNASTRVFWSSSNVSACAVTGDNGDSWTGRNSPISGRLSRAIARRTIYTLACVDLRGETVTKTATVNIVPTWQEI